MDKKETEHKELREIQAKMKVCHEDFTEHKELREIQAKMKVCHEDFTAAMQKISNIVHRLINNAHWLIDKGEDEPAAGPGQLPKIEQLKQIFKTNAPAPVTPPAVLATITTIKTIHTIATQALEVYKREPQLCASPFAVEIEDHAGKIALLCKNSFEAFAPAPGMTVEIRPPYTVEKIVGQTVNEIQKNALRARQLYKAQQEHDPASVTVDALMNEIDEICTELLERFPE